METETTLQLVSLVQREVVTANLGLWQGRVGTHMWKFSDMRSLAEIKAEIKAALRGYDVEV